jgi:hypothetical protein
MIENTSGFSPWGFAFLSDANFFRSFKAMALIEPIKK